MEVLNFMNTHDDWEEILTQPPYCIKVNRDDKYILLFFTISTIHTLLFFVLKLQQFLFYLFLVYYSPPVKYMLELFLLTFQ